MPTIINGSSPSITFSDSTTQASGVSSVGGVVQPTGGGTGAATLAANNVLLGNGTSALQTVAPGASGNVLRSNGTTWQSVAPSGSGTVTSVATGNGLQGGTITSTGTLSVACPAFNTVGSYAYCLSQTDGSGTLPASGANLAAGGGTNQASSGAYVSDFSSIVTFIRSNNLAGTWRHMGGGGNSGVAGGYYLTLICRVA